MSLAIIILPIIVKRRLQELKFTTYVLFFGVICLIALLSVKLGIEGSYNYRVETHIITPAQLATNSSRSISAEKIMDSINIAVAS